ncbi:HAD-like domain-containing protein [Podospora fimiseda]|uniref:HAD-like domain-containing protein n=1 Tax=Podospora fimiseda TaxID=252190 RepID=A0AAN7BVH6_9PEZI|nr:HAD-like domain-containing protein [Podospora fimiseda]
MGSSIGLYEHVYLLGVPTMMATPRLFIINFENTLFDTNEAIWRSADRTFKTIYSPRVNIGLDKVFTPREVVNYVRSSDNIKSAFTAMLQKISPNKPVNAFMVNAWAVTYKQLYMADGIQYIKPLWCVYELLKTLKEAKIPTVIFANKLPKVFVMDIFKRNKMDHLIDEFMIMAETGIRSGGGVPPKPDAGSYKEYGLEMFSSSSSSSTQRGGGYYGTDDVLVVGDSEDDIRYGKAIGASICWVSNGYEDREQAERCTSLVRAVRRDKWGRDAFIVRHLAELNTFIERIVNDKAKNVW